MTFYTNRLGFVLDVDVRPAEGMRVVQLTPSGSACSIVIGTGLNGISDMTAGTLKGLRLVVNNIDQAREELLARDVEVGEVVDVGGGVKVRLVGRPGREHADPAGDGLANRRELLKTMLLT